MEGLRIVHGLECPAGVNFDRNEAELMSRRVTCQVVCLLGTLAEHKREVTVWVHYKETLMPEPGS